MEEMLLETNGLSRHFGGVKAVDCVQLALKRDETLGLIGPNGAGKTTLFNLLTGLTPPTSGTVQFKGRHISNLPSHRIAALGMSRTFQNIRLFPGLTVMEHVQIGAHCRTRQGLWGSLLRTRAQRKEEAEILEKGAEILSFLGLTEYEQTPATDLSYGWQRRVEIARALASSPSVLLLDEPAAGMNDTERAELRELIRSLRSRVDGIILIEHDMDFVMNLCDRVAVLNFGRLIAEGTPTEIQRHPEVIQAYLGEEA